MSKVMAIEDNPKVLKVANRLVKAILQSPLHELMSRDFMLVNFIGRKTGKAYTTPVACIRDGDAIYFATGSNWWKNLQGQSRIQLVVAGRKIRGKPEIIQSPQDVALLLHKFIFQIGVKKAYLLGLKVEGTEMPSLQEVETGVNGSRIVVRIEALEELQPF